jgi:hypothetical protein
MENGKIVAEGTHEQLLAREPGYAAVLAKAEADRERTTAPKTKTSPKDRLRGLLGGDEDRGGPAFEGPQGGFV